METPALIEEQRKQKLRDYANLQYQKHKQKRHQYYLDNRTERLAYQKTYSDAHRDDVRRYWREYHAKRKNGTTKTRTAVQRSQTEVKPKQDMTEEKPKPVKMYVANAIVDAPQIKITHGPVTLRFD